jgi:NDP-sugar pyrophosphorylase family protein
VLNGDDLYSPLDLQLLMQNDLAVLAVRRSTPVKEPMEVEGGAWKGFGTPGDLPTPHYLNCGAYVLDDRYFSVPMKGFDNRGAIEYGLPHTFVQLAEQGERIVVVEATFWLPVGTHEELQAAEAVLTKV